MLSVRRWFASFSRADPIQDRPGFAALLDRIEANGVRTVIVDALRSEVEPRKGS